MMRSGGSGEDMARQYDIDWSSADDVYADDADESSMSTDENDAHVTDNGRDNNEVNDGESSPGSDDDEVKHQSRQ